MESPCAFCDCRWQTGEPPRDRAVVILANLVNHSGALNWAEPVCGEVVYDADSQEWLFQSNGLAVRQSSSDELHIRYWIDVPKNLPERSAA